MYVIILILKVQIKVLTAFIVKTKIKPEKLTLKKKHITYKEVGNE